MDQDQAGGADMKRLRKQERQKLIEQIRQEQGKKTIDAKRLSWFWFNLAWDQYRYNLCTMIRPLRRLSLLNHLRTSEGDDFDLGEYAKHYDDEWIDGLMREVEGAQKGLSWLRDVLVQEKLRRTGNRSSKKAGGGLRQIRS